MAQEHNAIIYATQISKAASQAAGGAYSDTGISRLGETLTPVIDLWTRPEWAFLRQELLWGVVPAQVAVIGQFSQIGVASPVDSRLIVVVQGFYNVVGTGSAVTVRLGASIAFAATGNPVCRDTRKLSSGGVSGTQTISFAHAQAANLGTRVGVVRFGNNVEAGFIPYTAVLAPGTFLALEPLAANLSIEFGIVGYERQAFPGELRG